jgi:hypothetical protein
VFGSRLWVHWPVALQVSVVHVKLSVVQLVPMTAKEQPLALQHVLPGVQVAALHVPLQQTCPPVHCALEVQPPDCTVTVVGPAIVIFTYAGFVPGNSNWYTPLNVPMPVVAGALMV